MKITIATTLLACGLAACSNNDAPDDSDNGRAEKLAAAKMAEEAATAVVPGPWAGYDKTAISNKFEGSWVVRGSGIGTRLAWNVKDGAVTISSGADDKTYKLEIESPCSLRLIEESEDGILSTTSKFAWRGDVLYKGTGHSGSYRADGSLVACVSGGTYTFANGSCTSWKKPGFGSSRWKESPAECGLVDGDAKVFEVGSTKLELGEGGALMDSQMKGNKAERFPDFDAAKAALTAK